MDPEFLISLRSLGPSFAPPPVKSVEEYRAAIEPTVKALGDPLPSNVNETKFIIKSYDDAAIELYHLIRSDAAKATEPQPAVLYLHGGGIISCKIDNITRGGCYRAAASFGVPVFAIEYRLAPEHPYPTPIEDCYAALKWVSENASQFNVDPARIALIGDSGGGCLTAGVSLLARDRKFSPPIARQLLIYPMLDDMATARVDSNNERGGGQLDAALTRVLVCWDAYIGPEKRGKADANVPPYASPGRAQELAGLPFTYLECGALDVLRNEALDFASKLTAAGVETELHIYAGVPHAFDLIAPTIPLTVNALENRLRIIRNL